MKITFYLRFLCFLLALCLCACGLKGDPRPKSSLNIPVPDFDLTLSEEGVYIENRMDDMLVVQRAESEIGDISAPEYDDLARIAAGQAFIDNTTEYDVRYLYRFRTYDTDYNAYSSSVTRVVSYRGVVKIDNAHWTLGENTICITAEPSSSTDRVQVIINGIEAGDYNGSNSCYPLPAVPNILLLMVPYSDSNTPGTAFSATVERDLTQVLLPPQNIVALRRDNQLTLSWDAIPGASKYMIYTTGGVQETASTLFSLPVTSSGCTQLRLSTVRNNQESQTVTIESCP